MALTFAIVFTLTLSLLSNFATSLKAVSFRQCHRRHISLKAVAARTYVPIPVKTSKSIRNGASILLVKSDETEIIQIFNKKTTLKSIKEQIDLWEQTGKAFFLEDDSSESMIAFEIENNIQSTLKIRRKPLPSTARIYRNAGTEREPVYVKATAESVIRKDGGASIVELSAQGKAFKNVTELFLEERVLSKTSSIARRVKRDFPLSSQVWKRWNNQTMTSKTTGLGQVFAEYFQDYSIGDVGGAKARYIPKRGFPGTLAPGDNFIDNYPIEELPNKVLHPWPSLQEFQIHVRWPVAHPMIPHPLLFFALNKMIVEQDYRADQMLENSSTTVMGGQHMRPVDAIRVASFHDLGLPWHLPEQIPHGGMQRCGGGRTIPFYNPYHSATTEQIELPIPDEMIDLTQKWHDPYEIQNRKFLPTLCEPASEEEVEEEELRRVAAEKIIEAMGDTEWKREDAAAAAAFEAEYQGSLQRKREAMIIARAAAPRLSTPLFIADQYPAKLMGQWTTEREMRKLYAQFDIAQAKKEAEASKQAAEIMKGRVRGSRQTLKYVVEDMLSMQQQIIWMGQKPTNRGETAKKRRRQRKKKPATVVEAAVEITPQLVDAEPIIVDEDNTTGDQDDVIL